VYKLYNKDVRMLLLMPVDVCTAVKDGFNGISCCCCCCCYCARV